jgi:hypothetical protein
MEVIYEIKHRFRVTYIPVVQLYEDAPQILCNRPTPFIINHRAPDADRAEHCELTDELFRLFLSVTPENRLMFDTLMRFLPEQYPMSAGMVECLLAAPKNLLRYCKSDASKMPTLTREDYWRDARTGRNLPPEGHEVLACVRYADRRRYSQEFAVARDDGWYDRKGRPLSGVEHWRYKTDTPAFLSPDY